MTIDLLGFYICLALSICFACITLVFALLKEKGAMLISGFNTLSKSQRDLYDKKKMVRDQRNSLLLWTLVLGIGAILSYFFSQYFGFIALIIWFILFCKEVHFDVYKALEKYKK